MRVTLRELTESNEALLDLAKQVTKPSIAVGLANVLRESKTQLEIYGALQNNILQRYGEERSTGSGVFNIPNEKRDAFAAAMKDLNETQVKLRDVGKYRLETLTANGVTVSGDALYKLNWLIKTESVAPEFDEMPQEE